MSPLVLPHTRSLLVVQPSHTPASNLSSMTGRVVFILCIVFGSLLVCVLAAILFYFFRRHKRKKRDTATLNLRRDSSFIAGAPSVIDIAPPQPSRRPSLRNAAPHPRIIIPSPELGSVFRLDAVANLARRGSSAKSRPSSGSGSTPPTNLKALSPHYESLFSRTSTVVASPGLDKYDMPLRVMNHSSLASRVEPQLQKPSPAYQAGRNSSRERLVSSAASADSLFTGSTSTPPLSPSTWSRPGTNTTDASFATSAAVHKSLSRQSFSTRTSSPPHVAVECHDVPPYLMDDEHTPRAHGPLSSLTLADRLEIPPRATGTPVTLSHFPFRFSAGPLASPSLSSIGSPVPSSGFRVLSPGLSSSHLDGSGSQVHGLGLNNALSGSRQSLPAHSTPSLKLKLKRDVSDEIIAIAFAPQTINFQAVSDAVRGRLGFEPRRVWSDEGAEVIDDTSLWIWLNEQYTKGHTRLMLHVE